ncbi:TetR/AcrR family transcriptional regulator [Mesorhizobium sp. YC-39]|uniref:TetR/AcrR family transcriptional regulator n=1 Tax=unclassified Mesorhizobium TaxID=325217 RepID=UPI0021E88C51|nr:MULTISPECIES: TetR/AcrR family transcriptional regulator [unclassified Mesorhizobium]MCV3208004.1 TetR/AcrR family transcriptional regulator [Mesorhizobium sp. YC-2]MCV3229731.1 TetR/AcrR family transcriptional regulator [Mesorhizobium sp. YC-39]
MLDAAERLLQASPDAEFSMRALAAEAGVGFATPFNHFGSKNAIMQALSSRLIERMATRFRDEAPDGDAIDRVLVMGRISVALLLEKPTVHKAVVGSLGVASSAPSTVHQHSRKLWSLALGDFAGIAMDMEKVAHAILAEQLAFDFRGCVSFWIAGELRDEDLGSAFEVGACVLLLGFANPKRRTYLIRQIKSLQSASIEEAVPTSLA